MLSHHKGKEVKIQKLKIVKNKQQRDLIYTFLQGTVYAWCNSNVEQRFCIRDLVGGNNRNWQGTPLQQIYQGFYEIYHYEKNGDEKAYKETKKAIGHALKYVLNKDKRNFIFIGKQKRVNYYCWKIT